MIAERGSAQGKACVVMTSKLGVNSEGRSKLYDVIAQGEAHSESEGWLRRLLNMDGTDGDGERGPASRKGSIANGGRCGVGEWIWNGEMPNGGTMGGGSSARTLDVANGDGEGALNANDAPRFAKSDLSSPAGSGSGSGSGSSRSISCAGSSASSFLNGFVAPSATPKSKSSYVPMFSGLRRCRNENGYASSSRATGERCDASSLGRRRWAIGSSFGGASGRW